MPKQELCDCINLGAKNYFPFPVTDSFVDSEIIGEISENGVKKFEAVVAVSPKVTIDRYLQLLKKAQINPAAFIPVPLALQRLAEVFYAKEDKVRCFINIGAVHTELAVLKGKKLIFSRKIPVVGDDFTKALTGVLVSDRGRIELSLEEAESIKREIGIPSETDASIINNKISAAQILSMLRTPLTQFVNEIERCFDYYREDNTVGRIETLVLCGSGASLKGLTKFLSSELGMEVRLANPISGFKVISEALHQNDKNGHSFAVAMGAALSQTSGVNLLPAEFKEKTKRLFKRATFETTAAVIVLIMAFVYIGSKIKLSNYQKRAAVAELELSSLEPQLKQAKVLSLLANEPYWMDVFKELSNIIPNDVYITKFSLMNKTITLKGVVPLKQNQEIISNFIAVLEKGMFNNVKLVSSKDVQGKATKEFVLNCRVD
jgi:type IV pilus assembly protein PilM